MVIFLATVTPSTIFLSVEFLPSNQTPLLFFRPSRCVLCLNSRCSNISFHELILNARSSRRSFPIEFLSVSIVLDEDLKSMDVKINLKQLINISEKDSWIVKTVLALCSLCLLTSRLESRDEILI